MTDGAVVFGPGALATPANLITLTRIALTPVFVAMILGSGASWPTFAMGFALAVSDGVDGYLARRHGTTRSGAFLDPLADKLLVLGGMGALVVSGVFWWVPVALIAAREAAVSVMRARLGRQGLAVHARPLAKVKTVVQELAIGAAILPGVAELTGIGVGLLWGATVLTVITGVQYLADGRAAATTA